MSGFVRNLTLALSFAWCGLAGRAQTASPSLPDLLITTTFVAPMKYAAALERLSGYYDVQVGRKGPIAFPEIAPNRHFEIWHDIWALFDPSEDRTRVTLKKMADAASARVAKGYMLDIGGWLNAESPLVFHEEAGLRTVESEICTTRKNLAAALAGQPGMRLLASWRDSGLLVSAEPLTKITLSPSRPHGMRQIMVSATDGPSAKALLAKVQQQAASPGICGAFSEEIELEAEIHETAQRRNDTISDSVAAPTLYHPQMDLKYLEDRLRSEPAMQKRLAAARGSYDVRFRVDRAYRTVTVAWSELTGYSAATGSFAAARDLGQTLMPNVRQPAVAAAPLTARVRLEPLKAGAFRVRLSAEGVAGEAVPIDERIFSFNGKTFEEPQDLGQ